MKPGWERTLRRLADEFNGRLEDRGAKFVIHLPNGTAVWCAKTPRRPSPDRVRRNIQYALTQSTFGYAACR